MLPEIPHKKVVSILRRIDTVGNSPLHVICDDYEGSYFVKNHTTNTPAYTLINEVICHFLLREWTLKTPDIALVTLGKELNPKEYGPRHKQIYYDRLAFGSKEVEGAFEIADMFSVSGQVEYRKYRRPIDFARIGLFDLWVENDDRGQELKNLMMISGADEKYDFLAIDHAHAFRTGAYTSLTHKTMLPPIEDSIISSSIFPTLKRFYTFLDRSLLTKEVENYYLCIEKCKSIFPYIKQKIPDSWGYTEEINGMIYDFLFDKNRNELVINEYLRLLS